MTTLITLLTLTLASYDYSAKFPCEGLGFENFKETKMTSFSSELIQGEDEAYSVIINSCKFVLSVNDLEFMNVEKVNYETINNSSIITFGY